MKNLILILFVFIFSNCSGQNNFFWSYNNITTAIPTVTNPTTGMTWMDRNLGATQVATSSTDAASYGDLYQWGRFTDGHQLRTSGTTTTLSSTDTPGNANFIKTASDWRSPRNDNLWQGVTGINNSCPTGFRMPTDAEFTAEMATWSSQDAAGAFGSVLKLPAAGYRSDSDGALVYADSYGYYWTSTIFSVGATFTTFSSSTSGYGNDFRGNGMSVRCIKDY